MPEAFIVTIVEPVSRFEIDLEIPAQLPFSAFRAKLLEILKSLDPQRFSNWRTYRMLFERRVLSEADTLAKVGAFDGSRLIVERI